METKDFQRFRTRLLEQRRNLTEWLTNTPESRRQVNLGAADERSVHEHIHVLDVAIGKSEDGKLGYCEVCDGYLSPGRVEIDYTSCICLEHLTGDERSRLELDLELSVKVQKSLLPQVAPDIPGLDVAAFSKPAKMVGGDYFDFFRYRDGAHGIVIGDVMGHGIAASMLMASLQASLQTLARDYNSPVEIVKRLNALFCHNVHLVKFVTLFISRFDPETRALTYSNAGHNPPIVVHPGSNGREPLSWLDPTGAAIGLVENTRFEEKTVSLTPGDTLIFYTDGVTEARTADREEFGPDRLAELAARSSNRTAQELIGDVREGLQAFTGGLPLEDDTTLVVGRVEGR